MNDCDDKTENIMVAVNNTYEIYCNEILQNLPENIKTMEHHNLTLKIIKILKSTMIENKNKILNTINYIIKCRNQLAKNGIDIGR